MCGPNESILGRVVYPIVNRFISNPPAAFPIAKGELRICGVLVQMNETNGWGLAITRVNELIVAPSPEQIEASIHVLDNRQPRSGNVRDRTLAVLQAKERAFN